MELHFYEILQCRLFFGLTYPQTVLFLLQEGRAIENLNLFGTIYTIPNPNLYIGEEREQ